jgi:ubiquinone/menaquinone biosynthesis C-methylase UbiE
MDAAIMLELIGVREGWRCLDLGCGPEGITTLLADRVGAAGKVVGLDVDGVFLEHARERARVRGQDNTQFVAGNVYGTDLPAGSFDLVHSRFVASTAGGADRLLQEAVRLTRPRGRCRFPRAGHGNLELLPSASGVAESARGTAQIFPNVGGNARLAQDLFQLLRRAGLVDVKYRPFLVGFRAGDPMQDYVPATIESVRTKLIEKGITTPRQLDAALAECRTHLADPNTVWTYHTVVQVWGCKPGQPPAQRA